VEGIAWDREQVPASEPKTKTKLSLPRCIYGMETQTYSKSDMERLERYQRKICRQLQQLPERCASTAVYALLGVEPIETAIDKNIISLFLGIARLPDC